MKVNSFFAAPSKYRKTKKSENRSSYRTKNNVILTIKIQYTTGKLVFALPFYNFSNFFFSPYPSFVQEVNHHVLEMVK